MCGIVGVYSKNSSQEKTLAGLMSLSYRGYDSAGIASIYKGKIHRLRAVGKLSELEEKYQKEKIYGNVCIGHTRWATHGKPTEKNAHPIVVGNVAVVHNGIIENYAELKTELQNEGVNFESDTDTEVVAALVNKNLENGFSPIEAVRNALKIISGTFAFGFIFSGHDNLIIAAKKGSPLTLGVGKDSVAICSDANGIAGICDSIVYLDDEEIAVIENETVLIQDIDGNTIDKKYEKLSINPSELEKGVYETFMMKEINEQPAVVAKTILNNNKINFEKDISSLNIIACGTSFHAGLVGKYWFEKFRKIKTNVEIASEFAYRNPYISKEDSFIVISQSGETSDVISAIKCFEGKNRLYSIVNVKNSAITKLADLNFYTEAGVEVGVASTKAFSTQLAVLAKLAFWNYPDINKKIDKLPAIISSALNCENAVAEIAKELKEFQNILFIGRDLMYPIALEGALKLKELSYIHAEAFAAGELKHGPIALIDEKVAIVALAPSGRLFDKTRSNIQELLARNGNVFVITDKIGKPKMPNGVKAVVLPEIDENLSPFIYTIPLQFLAYYISKFLGRDIDRPRNLAKSITVE